MTRYKLLKVGKPFDLEKLTAEKKSGGRQRSPRDTELERLVAEVASGL